MPEQNGKDKRLIVALDYPSAEQALTMARLLAPDQCRVKVGKELFTREGPDVVRKLQDYGFDVFLDLKYHDIPNTVAKAVLAASELGVWMLNVHASGGVRMMQAAREALETISEAQRPILIAVTVLTSMDQEELEQLGVTRRLEEQARFLASNARRAGLDGVVCSAWEAGAIKSDCGADFLTITPGIRPASSSTDDQRRVMTPFAAVRAGSDYLVVGRPVTGAADPARAITEMQKQIAIGN